MRPDPHRDIPAARASTTAGGHRLLHLASGDRWGGAEAQLYTLLKQLHAAPGWRVEAVLLNDFELAQRLRDAGIEVTILDEDRLDIVQLYRSLARHVAARRPALIHTHRQKENILGALVARRFGIASLRTVHGATEHPPRGLRQLHKHLLFGFDRWLGRHVQQRLIAVSDDLHRQLRAQYPAERLATIENGIDIDGIRSAARQAADLDAHVPAHPEPTASHNAGVRHIGIVGRLDAVKRIDLFLEMAAGLIRDGRREWHFHIFGEGRLDAALKQQAETLGIRERVTFHGHRQDIAACLAALDALVMCSDHEGLPMTVLEAITVGTPVLAHAVGGLVAVLANECGGLLVDEHDPAAYAAGLEQLLNHDRDTLITAGQARIRQYYSAEANATAVTGLYRQLLTPPAATA